MKNTFLIAFLLSVAFMKLNAQGVTFFGSTFIDNGGTMYVQDFPVQLQGTIFTTASTNPGMLALSENTVWQSESNDAFVDGFVKSYHTGEFEFPIGNATVFAPMSVASNGQVAAQYLFDITANATELSEDLDAISELEYWNVLSDAEGLLSLTWRAESELTTLTSNAVENLRMAGWNSVVQQWEIIPFENLVGNLNEGSMDSQEAIDFTTYTAFTFGMKATLNVADFTKPNVFIFIRDGYLSASSSNTEMINLSFFDMTGRALINFTNIHDVQFRHSFRYPKGVYIARITLENGQVSHQKIMNQ